MRIKGTQRAKVHIELDMDALMDKLPIEWQPFDWDEIGGYVYLDIPIVGDFEKGRHTMPNGDPGYPDTMEIVEGIEPKEIESLLKTDYFSVTAYMAEPDWE